MSYQKQATWLTLSVGVLFVAILIATIEKQQTHLSLPVYATANAEEAHHVLPKTSNLVDIIGGCLGNPYAEEAHHVLPKTSNLVDIIGGCLGNPGKCFSIHNKDCVFLCSDEAVEAIDDV